MFFVSENDKKNSCFLSLFIFFGKYEIKIYHITLAMKSRKCYKKKEISLWDSFRLSRPGFYFIVFFARKLFLELFALNHNCFYGHCFWRRRRQYLLLFHDFIRVIYYVHIWRRRLNTLKIQHWTKSVNDSVLSNMWQRILFLFLFFLWADDDFLSS